MQWLVDLFYKTDSVPHAILMLMLVSAIGLALGHVKVKGISLGIAWVLFVGLIFSHFGFHANHEVLHFLREFGLILFVFTIGIQVGPGFFATLKRNGLALNLAAAAIVLVGVAVAVLQWKFFMGGNAENVPAVVGLLSGATTNTPSMASGTTALEDLARRQGADASGASATIAAAYAIAYPIGIFGVLLTMLVVRFVYRINVADEQRKLEEQHGGPALEVMNIEVANPALAGRPIRQIPLLEAMGVNITRVMRGDAVVIASPDALLQLGDVLTAVGPKEKLAEFEVVVGRRSHLDPRAIDSDLDVRGILVSNSNAVGRTISELNLRQKYGVVMTRIQRAGIELPVTPNSTLQFGDRVIVVGDAQSLPAVTKELGDSVKALDKPMMIPLLAGIALGVIFGSIPIAIPGLPVPLKLGLAGGPLIIAICLSRIYRIGPLVWYMPTGANYMLRELGIVLFLACVGLLSGEHFVETFRRFGAAWVAIGALITIVPVMLIGLIARGVFRTNYLTLTGLLAGSMTDPPALAFAQSITGSDAPTISYATVYPMVMLLRVMCTQIIVLLLLS